MLNAKISLNIEARNPMCRCRPIGIPWFVCSPAAAQSTSFKVQEGDVILVGTDGLFDNMNDDMILSHIAKLKVLLYFVFWVLKSHDFSFIFMLNT